MAIVKKEETFPLRPIIIVLFGQAGVGKTSLANTANNPILIDCDRGADRAVNRTDTLVVSSWDDVLADEKELKNYKTVIIDTAKSVLDDFLTLYVQKLDYKLKTNKLRMYGEIGDHFKNFIYRCRALDIDIVIISHVKEEKDGDIIKLSPDVTGQSKDLIMRIADQVGYISIINGQRVISFEPSDNKQGKNVAKIEDVVIPDSISPQYDSFMAGFIQRVKDAIQSMTKEQREAIETARLIQEELSEVKDAKSMNNLAKKANKLPKNQQLVVKNEMTKKAKSIGLILNTETKQFEDAPSSSDPA